LSRQGRLGLSKLNYVPGVVRAAANDVVLVLAGGN